MTASLIIVSVSAAMSLWWFRYACRLILDGRPAHDYAAELAAANRLEFTQLLTRAEGADVFQLREIAGILHREYYMLVGLLRHTSRPHHTALEEWLLRIDYHVMSVWFRVAITAFPAFGGRAIREMCGIVTYFAGVVAESANHSESATHSSI